MKLPFTHPSALAYYRDLQRELFILGSGKEYGDNIYIDHLEEGTPGLNAKTTLGAIKIAAFDELMAEDPVTVLRDALEKLMNDPFTAENRDAAYMALQKTKKFAAKR